MAAEEEGPTFHVVSADPSSTATILLCLVHQLTNRATLNDLERRLKRLALRRGERVYVSLGTTPSTPKATVKAACRLCAKHTVVREDTD